ncbi:hypothetical protein [Hymenobacter elongatus]|uniref:Uncharacterized protein n=1 Tax=Hymenobacter elongatus TaxID=877208 RepID=A0A4Z0PRU3_9BACT|nr:hypothetical protein [Hymenobacter elongatus]TGE19741.1 hypothetical protein E5J99_02985 [Hymenobacter elongatus]
MANIASPKDKNIQPKYQIMKAFVTLVLALVVAASQAEAGTAPTTVPSIVSIVDANAIGDAADGGLFKRKKYKYKKRRMGSKSRRHHGMRGR